MTIELTIFLSVVSVTLALLGYQLNKSKAIKTDGMESAEIKTQLGYISKGVDDIRLDIKTNERQMRTLGERVTRVEESSKQAHKRIDSIEGGKE